MQNPTPKYHSIVAKGSHLPIILSAPHAGQRLPKSLVCNSPLRVRDLLSTSDKNTDILVKCFPKITHIHANYARTIVDLNRPRHWLDSAVVSDAATIREPKILAGYGVIPRFAERGKAIRQGKISRKDAEAILSEYYDPYHQALGQLLQHTMQNFGQVLLIDVHSAPDSALKDIDLQFGTCFGLTIHEQFYHEICDSFARSGLSIAREIPFSGGHITQSYAAPDQGKYTLQIEINRKWLEPLSSEFLEIWQSAMQAFFAAYWQIAPDIGRAAE